ncbi:MAG: transglutaminase family protein [Acidimicrobiales bacterium]
MSALIESTWFLDHDSEAVTTFVDEALAAEGIDRSATPRALATALFHAVRDRLRYDPYSMVTDPEDYRASTIAQASSSWCVPKSVLLTAAARQVGIPARLGFADVRNHLSSEKLTARMGTDIFYWHGYSELLLDDRWFKVSSAFNASLCERLGVGVLEFDGTDDALMHPYDGSGNRYMEYVAQRGSYDDLPLDELLADFRRLYPSMVGDDAEPDEVFNPSA